MDKKNGFAEEQQKELPLAVEEQEVTVAVDETEGDEDENLIIELRKPYLFEGKTYTKIDLTGMDDMTATDLVDLERQYGKRYPGINAVPEVKVSYALMMAARAAALPLEFFYGLPQREAIKVKNRVMGFLFGSD